jgi:aminoglycoside phosphotransferase (APT) family kinase protein
VKWGSDVSVSEGQCLYTVGRLLKYHVPVPEIYGWREDGGEIFLYMENLQGQTLEQVWENIDRDDRDSLCAELRMIFDKLRQIEQKPTDPFIGKSLFQGCQFLGLHYLILHLPISK